MNNKLFFETSKQVSNRLTETIDFVWGTAIAHWNLRGQVDDFIRQTPSATDVEINDRFSSGSGIRGVNLRRTCVTVTWDVQQEQFARILLVEFCALYEAWIDGVLDELQIDPVHSKNLQFPTSNYGGIQFALSALQSHISAEMELCIYPTLITNKKNSREHLENLVVCHRYFKECRNAVIHGGGVATRRTLEAYKIFAAESSVSLGVAEIPQHIPIAKLGDTVRLSLRGVVGYGEIVLRLVSTLDAELTKTAAAEVVMDRRWRNVHRSRPLLPTSESSAISAINGLVKQLEIPVPAEPLRLMAMLRRRGLVASIKGGPVKPR